MKRTVGEFNYSSTMPLQVGEYNYSSTMPLLEGNHETGIITN